MTRLARDDVQLDAFELEAGLRLPDDYRAFLLETDRELGLGSYDLDGERLAIPEPYAFASPDPIRDVATRRHALRGLVPSHLLAFARDEVGNLLCIGIKAPRPGGVYLVRVPRAHQTPNTPRFLAPTFAEFLGSLEPASADSALPAPRPTRRLR